MTDLFVIEQNIRRFAALLEATDDPERQRLLSQLLTSERLRRADVSHGPRRSPPNADRIWS